MKRFAPHSTENGHEKKQRLDESGSESQEIRSEKRKNQNRIAAQKSREKKMRLIATTSDRLAALEAENKKLHETIKEQNDTLSKLMARLDTVALPSAPNQSTQSFMPQLTHDQSSGGSSASTPSTSLENALAINFFDKSAVLVPLQVKTLFDSFYKNLLQTQLEKLTAMYFLVLCLAQLVVSSPLHSVFRAMKTCPNIASSTTNPLLWNLISMRTYPYGSNPNRIHLRFRTFPTPFQVFRYKLCVLCHVMKLNKPVNFDPKYTTCRTFYKDLSISIIRQPILHLILQYHLLK
jgi:hypothetical protein